MKFFILFIVILMPANSFSATSNLRNLGGGIPTYSAIIAGGSETSDCSSGTCTIYLEGATDWISSATRASAGNYTVNFQSGIFTTGAICQITVTNGIRITRAIRGGTSSTNFITYTDAGAPNDSAFNIFCKDAI